MDDCLDSFLADSPAEVREALHTIVEALDDEAAAALLHFLSAWIAGPKGEGEGRQRRCRMPISRSSCKPRR
jgi:hypothetical protein